MIGFRPSAALEQGEARGVVADGLTGLPAAAPSLCGNRRWGARALCTAQPKLLRSAGQGMERSSEQTDEGSPHPVELFRGARLTRRTLSSAEHGIALADYLGASSPNGPDGQGTAQAWYELSEPKVGTKLPER